VVVAGKTFQYGPTGPQGLVPDKRVIIALARGGIYPQNAPFEHAESYLRTVFGFMGVTDITFVRAEGLAISPEHRQKALDAAVAAIPVTKAA
jgi:FMN-dependent NADH-azoreductase